MERLTVISPAKLNLVLDVVAKRPDGFHELRTIFERINLVDEITFTHNRVGVARVRCSHADVPLDGSNLVIKAAMLLMRDFNIKEGVDIRILKRIPVAAGLGGGSSNAASVLLGLNRWWGLGLGASDLVRYAACIGSDVAFFIYDCPYALGMGRGERIKPLAVKTQLWHLLVTPRVQMPTKDVFARFKLNLTNKKDNVRILLPFLKKGDVMRLAGFLSNDLESAILAIQPHFVALKQRLIDAGALGVCFSGSGSSVFALAESQAHACALQARFDKRYAQVFVVHTL